VFARNPKTGERVVKKRYNDLIGVSFPSTDPQLAAGFRIFDVALLGDRLLVLRGRGNWLALEELTGKPDPEKQTGVGTAGGPIDDMELYPLMPLERGTIVPVSEGAFVLFESKNGKCGLWKVGYGKATRVWITESPPKDKDNPGGGESPPRR
jgi:hypothetical protein